RVVRECFKERVRPAVRLDPRRLARAARPLDDDDHVRSIVMRGRSRRVIASGSAIAIPTTPATRNGPTQPEPRSSATPATTGPSDPIPNPATACNACADPMREAGASSVTAVDYTAESAATSAP